MPKSRLVRGSKNKPAKQIREAIGASNDEPVIVITPQFERTPDMPPAQPPPGSRNDMGAWVNLRTMTRAELKALGCGNWDRRLMLFPGEWYAFIPNGFEIVNISGRSKPFVRGETSDDIRFGCLAYGVIAADASA